MKNETTSAQLPPPPRRIAGRIGFLVAGLLSLLLAAIGGSWILSRPTDPRPGPGPREDAAHG